jgi:serine O-acetyltransferase
MSSAGESIWVSPPTDPHNLDRAIQRIEHSVLVEKRISHISQAPLPDRVAIHKLLERITWILFPGFFGPRDISPDSLHHHLISIVSEISHLLVDQIGAALRYEANLSGSRTAHATPAHDDVESRASTLAVSVIDLLATIRESLSLDVQAAFDGDPAAEHTDEIVFSYPGLRALSIHRVAHEMYRLGIPLIPRIMSEFAHSETGIDIHPGARIGRSFFIDHGTGVVIGETTIIGDHCKIYQGVTLGAKSFAKDDTGRLKRGDKRHPTLEDHVTVYAGATILGGDTIIGAGSVITGGVFLSGSVAPGIVVGAPRVELTMGNNPEMRPGMYNI